ncbi:MAG: hypothetical protein AAGE59_34830 [Cyanobacteria bacterium P01_F01_bin.86]
MDTTIIRLPKTENTPSHEFDAESVFADSPPASQLRTQQVRAQQENPLK